MSQATAPVATLRAPSFDDLDFQLSSTRRMLEAIPEEHWGWRPHVKSMTVGEVANHIVFLLGMADAVVRRDAFDLTGEEIQTASGREELLRHFDERAATLRASVATRAAEEWSDPWQLTRGDVVLRSMPRGLALRIAAISHLVHHRGQLSVFLRLLDTPVPGLYGPSADER